MGFFLSIYIGIDFRKVESLFGEELAIHQGIKQIKRSSIVVQERLNAQDPELSLLTFSIADQIDRKVAKEFPYLKRLS